MSDNTSFAALLKKVMAVSVGHRWLVPVLVGLGLLAFFFEGMAIYLLLPLLETLAGGGSSDLGFQKNILIGFMNTGTAGLAPETRRFVLVAAIVICIFLKGMSALASYIAYSYAGARFGDDIRRTTFGAILRADQSFLDQQEPGALLNTLATETWRLSQALQALAQMILNACAVVIFLTLMLALSWQMTIAVGMGVLIILAIVYLSTLPAKKAGEDAVVANQELASRISEGLAGLRTIRLFAREAGENARFAQASDGVRRKFLRMEILSAIPAPFMEVLFALLLGLLLIGYQAGELPYLIVFLALLLRLQPHAGALMHARVTLLTLAGSLDNVATMRAMARQQSLISGAIMAPPVMREIALENVSFRYAGSPQNALSAVSFTIPVHKTTAIVGASGAGKSTILGLLTRLADPVSGAILVDGQDLRGFDIGSWRRRIASVPQDVFLFNASIRENIAYGRPDATPEEICAAARAAHAEEFITALPQGYDTIVGDRGARFSGGQRQRLALARAFLTNPDILILDEATNALDSRSERFIQDALTELAGRFTVIVVAHRLSSILRADNVIVLEGGQVTETGPPKALLQAGRAFEALFKDDHKLN